MLKKQLTASLISLLLTAISIGNGEFFTNGTVIGMENGVAMVQVQDQDQLWPVQSMKAYDDGAQVNIIFEVDGNQIINPRFAEGMPDGRTLETGSRRTDRQGPAVTE